MNFLWRSPKPLDHSGTVWHDSEAYPGVRYAVRRVSLGQRIELMRRARELANRNEFARAGDAGDQFEAALRDLLVRRLYLEWGLASIEGLRIDGEPATTRSLAEKGPEILSDEVIESLRSELGLTEEERKNF